MADNDDGPDSDDSPASLAGMPGEFRSALDEFRNNWQRELQTQTHDSTAVAATVGTTNREPHDGTDLESESVQQQQHKQQQLQAESLFRKAAELESKGKVYDALPFYKKAVQLVPDIEFKYYEHQKLKVAASNVPEMTVTANQNQNQNVTAANDNNGLEGEEEELFNDLYDKFHVDLANGGKLLLSNRDASVITTERHISDLPPELILYILRWVVSSQLDLRSLEQCAAVSKGMYLCARDEELWRLACMKVWDYNADALDAVQIPTTLGYGSWRQMFLNRERVLYSGCYISKTTYLRMGENSFQDQFYRPVQLVEYFRYARFLPDGQVLMMTTADEPTQGVTKLRNQQQLRPDVLRGHYRLFGNTVSIVLKKQAPQRFIGNLSRQRRGSAAIFEENTSTSYCIEFRIMSTPKRKCVQLVWLHYSIELKRNKVVTSSEFDLLPSKYPPLWFSPVRSYHQDADAPLA